MDSGGAGARKFRKRLLALRLFDFGHNFDGSYSMLNEYIKKIEAIYES